MPDIIHLLPDAVANQIAAGEVVQRPASAVKEMMENAVDAGSTSVEVFIRDAGKALIQVTDNGCGMSPTDARMSLERHATSKIRSIEDLFRLYTMGFRGEALASIAAVAQVELKTRLKGEELGTRLLIERSEVTLQEPCSCPEGTSLSVKNLFFNVPARRTFLKSNPAETRHIIDEFQRVALAHPGIFFSLTQNDAEVYHLKPGNLRQRICGLFGNSYNERLVPVEEETDILRLRGFAGKPEHAKKTRGEQFFFVNKRYIRDPYLHHAVMNAYEDLVPKGSFPLYVLFIDIRPELIDVNIHPTKQEVKFRDERLVYAMLHAAVKRGLGQYSITPSLDFEQEQGFERFFVSPPRPVQEGTVSSVQRGIPSPQPAVMAPGQGEARKEWKRAYEELKELPARGPAPVPDGVPGESTRPYQVHQRYIVTHIKSGIMVIDQQGAHERILYEKYLDALGRSRMASQQQLFPQTVELPPADFELVKEILPEIRSLGFDLEEFGRSALIVHGIPSDLVPGEPQHALEKLLEQYKNNMSRLKLERRELLALTLARLASVKAGQWLEEREMARLINDLFACRQPAFTPAGRPAVITLTLEELAGRFEKKRS